MNNLKRIILLTLLVLPYAATKGLDLLLGAISLVVNGIRVPLSWAADKIVDKANEINTQ